MEIQFRKITKNDVPIIYKWLQEPHVQEFWDNTQEHKDDIVNFTEGRKQPSSYADGKYVYWVAKTNDHTFALIMTIQESAANDINEVKLASLSKTGKSYSIDYMIGDKDYFGKGLGATTLSQFVDFFRSEVDPKADTFLIDPATDNPRAKHVYMQADFEHITDFVMSGAVSGAGKPHHLLIKRFQPNIELVAASIKDYPVIQNMSRFYCYDLSRDCGHISEDWAIPSNGLYESFDFKNYFKDQTRKAFIVKVTGEIAGFVLLNQVVSSKNSNWNVGEFFTIAKFQKRGISKQIAKKLWDSHPGIWEVSVIPENKSALHFWHNTISDYTNGNFSKKTEKVDFDKIQPKRFIFKFNTKNINASSA